jgi:uncharacterized protein YcnI
MKRLLLTGLCLACSCAFAHPSFESNIVQAGKVFRAKMMVTHGCGDSPTLKLIIDVPEDVLNITPQVKPGWTVELVESKLKTPRVVFGMERTKYTSQIIWSGGILDSDYFDVFSFVLIPPSEEMTLHFPTTQVCVDGTEAYISVPGSDAEDEESAGTAPSLIVIKGTDAQEH